MKPVTSVILPEGTPPFSREMAHGMSEATLQNNILGLAVDNLGWLAYHTHDSRRSQPGFPDLVLVHDKQRRLIFAELKAELGSLSRAQRQWGRHLLDAGHGEYHVWRPSDWLVGRVTRILQARTTPADMQAAEAARIGVSEARP
jgi:hypothetical protein